MGIRLPEHETHWVTTDDGATVHVATWGEGPPLLLLNGFVCSLHYWPTIIERFSREYTVIGWDYRGYGASPTLNEPASATIERFADDAVCVLDQLGFAKAALVGHSMGCQVLFETYKRSAARVDALIAICGTYERPQAATFDPPGLAKAFSIWARAQALYPKPFGRFRANVMASELPAKLAYKIGANPELCPPQYIEALFEHLLTIDERVMLYNFASCITHSARDVLPQVRVPTLIIGGERDGMTPPKVSQEMHRRIDGSELFIAPKCSHLAMIERADLVNAWISSFLSRRYGQ